MAGAVNVGVVPILSLVLDCGSVNGDSTSALFWGGVDFVVLLGSAASNGGQGHGESCSESGLAVVDVADCADVDMGLLALELTSSSFDCETAVVVVVEGESGGGREVEDGGGVEEGRGEMG